MRRIIVILLSLMAASFVARAEQDSLKVMINDYSMIGVQYGVGFTKPIFTPTRNCEGILNPVNISVMFTKYGKMFGYMPYFGYQIGVQYLQEGYQFKINEKTGGSDCMLGARRAVMEVIKVPFLANFHVDFWKMKILASIGVYGGYRLSVKRSDYVKGYYDQYKQYEESFHPNENRFTYGLQGGGGFALVLDPIEVHFTVIYDFAFQYLHKPAVNNITLEADERSKYYYKWTYPTDLLFQVGVHYQLTRREGLTNRQLKQQAKEEVEQIYKEAMLKLDETVPEIKEDDITVVETPNELEKHEKDNGESR